MTLLDMQRVMSRILTDKAFLRAFTAGEVPDPAAYELTERELSSLRGLRWDRVGLHAELLAHGRLELAIKALPLTSLLLHEQLHGQLDRFCAEYPPVPQAASQLYVEATRLCEFAVRLLDEGVLGPFWAADIVSYEHVMLTLTTSPEASASSALVAEPHEAEPHEAEPHEAGITGDISGRVPVAGPHVRVLSFGCALPDLLPVLGDGVVPVTVPRLDQPLLVLFHKVWHGPVQMIKVNARTVALIEACDGTRTVAAVADLLRRRFEDASAPQAVQALRWLRDNGVIGLRKAG